MTVQNIPQLLHHLQNHQLMLEDVLAWCCRVNHPDNTVCGVCLPIRSIQERLSKVIRSLEGRYQDELTDSEIGLEADQDVVIAGEIL